MTTQIATQATNYDAMMDALRQYEATTSFETNDLSQADYKRDSEFGSLNWTGEKYELNEWAVRQLCRMTHIPYGAFKRMSESLAAETFKEFAPTVKDPQVKLAVKNRGKGGKTLRGILPVDYPDVRNSDILGALASFGEPFTVESAPWMDKSNPSMLRTRITLDRIGRSINNDDVSIGLDITSSELGDGPLQVNVLLYRKVCANGAIATYGKRPYFYYDYTGNFSFDVNDIMQSALNRAMSDLVRFTDAVEVAMKTACNLAQAGVFIQSMVDKGVLNKGISIKVLASLEKEGCNDVWDVVNAVTAQARGFRDELRLRYERAGGLLLGLRFDRSSGPESDYANNAVDVRDDFFSANTSLQLTP